MKKTKTPTQKARGALIGLVVLILVLFSIVIGLVATGNASWSPKLALDLEGGTEMILKPETHDGSQATQEQLEQAKDIITQRVDGSGVSEAEVNIQGGDSIVVAIPGEVSQEQKQLIQASAQMEFRPVLVEATKPGKVTGVEAEENHKKYDAKSEPKSDNYSDLNWVRPETVKEFNNLDCTKPDTKVKQFDPKKAVATCSKQDGDTQAPVAKYILGPVEVPGSDIANADASLQANSMGQTTNVWAVNIQFNDEGTKNFKKVTERITPMKPPENQFAIVLDGGVISAPRSQAVISDGKAQITGNFTQTSAKQLSDQLKYGSLPVTFKIASDDQISATLGSQQLSMGLLAGLIGLILVAIYSFFQYRTLGTVTIASLLVAGVITYLSVIVLGWAVNYRLSLAGIAGIIVSIGLTADSFIVYFERIRDELREGRSLVSAVEHGWDSAKQTILASKAVNLLAAVVLYVVAVGGVKGFAFTLGLTAVADLIVVFLFTHPVLQLLATTKFFGQGHPASGLDPERLGAKAFYQGAGKFSTDSRSEQKSSTSANAEEQDTKHKGAAKEAQKRVSIAERRRQERVDARNKALNRQSDTDRGEKDNV